MLRDSQVNILKKLRSISAMLTAALWMVAFSAMGDLLIIWRTVYLIRSASSQPTLHKEND
ncbi:hypothetical protein yinte0001_4860 [Yersinia intermedia ATCC 29909]|nr:hypothetical protein yinte0001_4860 [Yersinia intermedia ATCC 29909]